MIYSLNTLLPYDLKYQYNFLKIYTDLQKFLHTSNCVPFLAECTTFAP